MISRALHCGCKTYIYFLLRKHFQTHANEVMGCTGINMSVCLSVCPLTHFAYTGSPLIHFRLVVMSTLRYINALGQFLLSNEGPLEWKLNKLFPSSLLLECKIYFLAKVSEWKKNSKNECEWRKFISFGNSVHMCQKHLNFNFIR